MSLINEALKKAQRERGDTPPGPPSVTADLLSPASPPRVTARAAPKPAVPVAMLLGGGVVLLILVSLALAIAFWPKSPEPTPIIRTARSIPAATPPQVTVPAPTTSFATPTVLTTPVVPIPAPPPALPAVVTIKSPDAPAQNAAVAAAIPLAAVTVPAAQANNAPPTAPVAPSGPNPRITALIDSYRVTGILVSGNPPKVLMNGQVYKPSDIVDHSLGVRITQISVHTLTFVDANGQEYIKSF